MDVARTRLRRLTKRSQFLRAARGKRAGRPAFALQVVPTGDELPGVGFTVTKKTGNSPERNRIKRRLREAVNARAGDFHPGHDYVIVGRREALHESFGKLVNDLGQLLAKLHAVSTKDNATTNKAESLRNSQT